jgi:tetratricopeptide (TPR) repeat protein
MNTDEQWEVVTTGNVRFGMDPTVVAKNLRQRFKLNDASVARLLDGKPKTLKKGLDSASAHKYEAALSTAGVTVTAQRSAPKASPQLAGELALEPMAGEPIPDGPATGQPMAQPPTASLQPGQMQCPKCHAIQPKAIECRECGLIIDKYMASVAAQPTVDQPARYLPVMKIALGVAAIALLAAAYALYPKSSLLGTSPQAKAQERAVALAMSHSWPTPAQMQSLIAKGDYATAEQTIKYLQAQTLLDISWEDAYFATVFGISPHNGYTEAQLNQWVAATGSTTARLARGIYLQSAANNARGDKVAPQTSQAQFTTQTRLTKRARVDLEKALERDADLLPAYYALIWMDTVSGVETDKAQLLSDAIVSAPGTFMVRSTYLETIKPKWGGSYREMQEFTDASMRYLDRNPRLWALKGEPYAEQAQQAWMADDLDKTVDLYAKALSFGIDREWLQYSITLLEYLRRNDEARAYVATMLKYYPWDPYAKKMQAKLAR